MAPVKGRYIAYQLHKPDNRLRIMMLAIMYAKPTLGRLTTTPSLKLPNPCIKTNKIKPSP